MSGEKIKLAPRSPAGRNAKGEKLEAAIQEEIMRMLSRLPYVQFWRNNTGKLPDRFGRLVSYGLCPGSSDLIGEVGVKVWIPQNSADARGAMMPVTIGRFFALEVKAAGETPTDDQRIFLDVVRSVGGAATYVDNVDDAIAFVDRVRRCEDLGP